MSRVFLHFPEIYFVRAFALPLLFRFYILFQSLGKAVSQFNQTFRADGIFGCAEICGLKRKSNVVFKSFCHINRRLTEHSVPSRFGRIVVFVFVTERFGIARRFKQLAERSFLFGKILYDERRTETAETVWVKLKSKLFARGTFRAKCPIKPIVPPNRAFRFSAHCRFHFSFFSRFQPFSHAEPRQLFYQTAKKRTRKSTCPPCIML